MPFYEERDDTSSLFFLLTRALTSSFIVPQTQKSLVFISSPFIAFQTPIVTEDDSLRVSKTIKKKEVQLNEARVERSRFSK